jgi:hypothetical protein
VRSASYFKRRGRPKSTRVRKRDRHQKKKTKCSNSWCRQESHNKRSCKTANDDGGLTGRHNSDVEAETEVEKEVEAEAERGTIIIDVSIRTRGIGERRRQE